MSLEEFVYVVNNVGVPLALLAMIIFAMFRFLPEYIKRQQEKERDALRREEEREKDQKAYYSERQKSYDVQMEAMITVAERGNSAIERGNTVTEQSTSVIQLCTKVIEDNSRIQAEMRNSLQRAGELLHDQTAAIREHTEKSEDIHVGVEKLLDRRTGAC